MEALAFALTVTKGGDPTAVNVAVDEDATATNTCVAPEQRVRAELLRRPGS